VLGGFFAVVGTIWARPVVRLFGAADAVVHDGTLWLQTVAPFFVLRSVMSLGGALLLGTGDKRTPLVVHVSTSLLNVVVAWLLTQGQWGLPRLGVVGNGIGAATEQVVGGLAMLGCLVRLGVGRRVIRPGWRIQLAPLRRILVVGLPAGAEQVIFQIALASLLGVIAQTGTTAFAAHQISLRISFLASLPGWGISVAVTTLVGQALGQERPELASQYAYAGWWLGLILMGMIGLGLYALDKEIVGLFAPDAAVAALAVSTLHLAVLMLPLMAASFAYSGLLYGAGDTRVILLISLVATCAVRLGLAYWLALVLRWGLPGVWLAIGADYACRAALSWARYRSGRWQALQV
jgi:putative MATE family efflux protein